MLQPTEGALLHSSCGIVNERERDWKTDAAQHLVQSRRQTGGQTQIMWRYAQHGDLVQSCRQTAGRLRSRYAQHLVQSCRQTAPGRAMRSTNAVEKLPCFPKASSEWCRGPRRRLLHHPSMTWHTENLCLVYVLVSWS